MKLPRAYEDMLVKLHEAGGSGRLDNYGRVVLSFTDRSSYPMAGDQAAWMTLVAQGLVGGEFGKIILTQAGRDRAESIVSGQTREGA